MSLPDLSSYTQEQIRQVQNFSSAFQNYYDMLSRNAEGIANTLRLKRHRAWLSCVLAEYYQKASTQDICLYWSQIADQILSETCQLLNQEYQLNIALFAYGKLGSEELNLSSDVDLVFVSDIESDAHPQFLRKFQSLLQDVSQFGFCFRTDFDLRPGGRMGPLIPNVEQFVDYYGNYGEAWERLAFVRLRPIWGNSKVISDILKFTIKFTFRKHLDYTLLSDLKSLRQRIHSQYFHRTLDDQMDLKLGVGAIRDLELFVHALQVVHGGKDLDLRNLKTSDALSSLEQKKILPSHEVQFLRQHYWMLRRWENLIQAEADQQTHLLKKEFSLQPPFQLLEKELIKCDRLVSGLLGKVDLKTKTVPASESEQLAWLVSLGFQQGEVHQVWTEMISTTALSRQKERDEGYRLRFLYLFIEELAKYSQHRTRSFHLLRDFLKATRAKATFYSLFLNQEDLISRIARIFATAPYLASLLCSRPELIDSFVYKTQSQLSSADPQVFLDLLSERKLLSELVNGTDFLNNLDLHHLISRMTQTADQVASELLRSVEEETNCHLKILALGKWGGRELGLRSDLDFIFVTDEEPQERHLKAARKFFHRLTESHHRGGSLYSIDLRLKPSGKGGLVVTSFSQLLKYLKTEAEPWERQAYLRTRFLSESLSEKEIIDSSLARKLDPSDMRYLDEIRKALLKNASTKANEIDLKYGEGGMVDLEFATQIKTLERQQWISSTTSEQMKELGWMEFYSQYELMRLVEQIHQTVSLTSTSIIDFESESFESIASILRETNSGLQNRLRSALNDSQQLLKRLDPRRSLE